MTKITTCEYSPSHGQPLTRLDQARVVLLNKNGQHDITDRIRTVIQKYLGYKGTELFRTTFTKQQIQFTLKNGNVSETRTLNFVNNQWVLSHHNGTSPLTPDLGREVDLLVSEILSNVRNAHNSSTPVVNTASRSAALEALPQRQRIDVSDSESDEDSSNDTDLKNRITELEKSLATISQRNKELEADHQALQDWLDQDDESDNAVVELAEARKELENLQKINLKKDQLLQQQIAEGKSHLAFATKTKENLAELSTKLGALTTEKKRLEESSSDSESAIDELKQQILQQAEAYQELQARLEGKNEQLEKTLETSKKTIASTLALGEVALQQLRNEHARDQAATVQELNDKVVRLNRALEAVEKTYQERMKQQTDRVNKIYRKLGSKFPSLAVEFGALFAEFDEGKNLLGSMKSEEH